MERAPETYDPLVPNETYYTQPPDSPQSFYPPSASLPPLPPQNQQHTHAGSFSNSRPYNGHHRHGLPPSFKGSSYTARPMNTDANSSSFESHGSSHSHCGVPPYAGFGQPRPEEPQHNTYHIHPAMGYPPHPSHPQSYSWPASAPMELISNIEPKDVLSGRGGATNSHSGNRTFRAMVKQYQAEYLKAKKRDKPNVAASVVQLIRNKGGRFLRRYNSPGLHGEVLYYDIGDRRATEKACQALREGAPKRRKMDSDCSKKDKCCSPPVATLRGDPYAMGNETSRAQRDDNAGFESSESDAKREPSDIQPSASMMGRTQVDPIRLDELPLQERDIYLRDFVPPKATFQRGELNSILQVHDYCVGEVHPVVGV